MGIPADRKLMSTRRERLKNELKGDSKVIQTEKDEKTAHCYKISASIDDKNLVPSILQKKCSANPPNENTASSFITKPVNNTPKKPSIISRRKPISSKKKKQSSRRKTETMIKKEIIKPTINQANRKSTPQLQKNIRR